MYQFVSSICGVRHVTRVLLGCARVFRYRFLTAWKQTSYGPIQFDWHIIIFSATTTTPPILCSGLNLFMKPMCRYAWRSPFQKTWKSRWAFTPRLHVTWTHSTSLCCWGRLRLLCPKFDEQHSCTHEKSYRLATRIVCVFFSVICLFYIYIYIRL